MAKTMAKKTAVAKEDVVKADTIQEEKPVVETVEPAVVKPRKYNKDDLIPCKSITDGELLMVGAQSKMLYRWADIDDVQEVEYQDLSYDARVSGNASYSKHPRFIILDDEFVAQNPAIGDVYKKLYSYSDMRDILSLPVGEMQAAINGIPSGVKDSLKSIAGRMIRDGSLDSVGRIKALDEIFGTDMLHMLTDN